jgi:integrase
MARTFKKRGEWWIDFRGSDGKRHREPIGQSCALAKEVLSKRLNEVSEQRYFPGRVANAKTFSEIADKFWEQHGRFLKSPTWYCLFKKIKTAFNSKRIGAITPGDVQGFYNAVAAGQLNKKGRGSVATANRYHSLLCSIFSRAKDWGDFHGDNPCSRVKKGREEASRLRYLSQDEIKRLLAVAHPRLYPIVACAILTGMRRGEILGMAWENVSLESATIYLLRCKSGRPRQIPIPSKLREILLGQGPRSSGLVFDLSLSFLKRYFEQALKDAEIVGFRFHDLRHTFASHFIMRTNDLPALQNLLGHSSPTMTQRYAHLSKGHLLSNMATFEAAIQVKEQIPALEWHQGRHHAQNAVLPQA